MSDAERSPEELYEMGWEAGYNGTQVPNESGPDFTRGVNDGITASINRRVREAEAARRRR